MNLWNIKKGAYDDRLIQLCSGGLGVEELKRKLGEVPEDGGLHLGPVHGYFVKRFGFSP